MEPNTEPQTPSVGDLPMTPPPAPPAGGKMSDSELAFYDTTSVRLFNEKMDEIEEANKEFLGLSEKSKAAKGVWQALDEQLHRLIGERRSARGKPIQKTLLDHMGQTPATPVEQMRPAAEADPLGELWRRYPIDRLTVHGMTMKDAEKLQAGVIKRGGGTHPILTMGDLADWSANPTNPGFERHIYDFEGIGPGAATRINEATDLFWKQWSSGGQEDFARELGLVTHADSEGDGGAGSEPAGGGGGGDQPGEPGSPAAGADGDAARAAEARVYAPGEEAAHPDEVPLDAGDGETD